MAYNYGMNMPNAVRHSVLTGPGQATGRSGDASGTESDEVAADQTPSVGWFWVRSERAQQLFTADSCTPPFQWYRQRVCIFYAQNVEA